LSGGVLLGLPKLPGTGSKRLRYMSRMWILRSSWRFGSERMKVCPKCGFEESPCWKRSFQGNPNGDIDVARLDSLKDYEPFIANLAEKNRGLPMKNGIFVYYLAPRALWVKRILAKRFAEGGKSVFNIPHESGRPKKEVKG